MTEGDIIRRWKEECPVYRAWGQYVRSFIVRQLSDMISGAVEDFAEIIKCRLKSTESLVDKALYRQKGYKFPYDEIADKVGVRFVVHSEEDIVQVQEAIKSGSGIWNYKKSKDFAEIRCSAPSQFGYESDHYEITNNRPFEYNNVDIPAGIVCEVQVRTMLQHSLNVLEHHYLYKKGYTPANVQRAMAKCHAIAAALNDAHLALTGEIKKLDDPKQRVYTVLEEFYRNHIDKSISPLKSGMLLLDCECLNRFDNIQTDLADFVQNHRFIIERIKQRRGSHSLFRHPAILFAYLAVGTLSYARDIFPPELPDDSIKLVYADCGKSYDGGRD